MKCICDDCKREAEYMVHQQLEPHCEEHYKMAIEDCTVPTVVMTVEGYEEMMKCVGQSRAS